MSEIEPATEPELRPAARRVVCSPRLVVTAVPGLPLVRPGDDLPGLVASTLKDADLELAPGDVLVVTSKVVSRAEGRLVDLALVEPSPQALALAPRVQRDPRYVELILRESTQVSRVAAGVIVVRHRLGFIAANAGIDASNVLGPADAAEGSGPFFLLLPEDPDQSAERIRSRLQASGATGVAVVITDSFSRPFRLGTVGAAIGLAGMPAVWDRRGDVDLQGRPLETTITALGDQVAAAADLVAGQADEGRALVHVRGLTFPSVASSAGELSRRPDQDLYA